MERAVFCLLGVEFGVLDTSLHCLNSCPEPTTAGRWHARLQIGFPASKATPFYSAFFFFKSAKGLGGKRGSALKVLGLQPSGPGFYSHNPCKRLCMVMHAGKWRQADLWGFLAIQINLFGI